MTANRLVTLTGSGGVGKSRLAIEVAMAVPAHFDDGVDVVDLSPVWDSARLLGAVAVAVGVEERAGTDSRERLIRILRPQRRLLVLDNCEHLQLDCAGLADCLLARCPAVTVLATSRQSLGVPGEVVWRVPSLAYPSVDQPGSIEELQAYDAVALFCARAHDARPDLRVGQGDVAAVASICRQLDGIPLALELAAARVSALSVSEIAERLTDCLDLLVRSGSGPTRHRTLRASVEWSHRLLAAQERLLIGRLAVFAGAWSLEDAEAICGIAPLEAGDVCRVLATLVDKSLVQASQPDGGSWYRLPQPIKAFAHERLAGSGELDLMRARHGRYFADLGERSAVILLGPGQVAWASRLDREMGNLRAARDWCAREPGRSGLGLRLASGLWEYWHVRGLLEDGANWLEDALARAPSPTRERAAALGGLGVIVTVQGELERGCELLAESIALYQQVDDTAGQARAWTHLGNARGFLGDTGGAAEALDRGLKLARRSPGSWHEAWALFMSGLADALRGDTALARARMTESSELFARHGDHRAVGYTRIILGDCLVRDGLPADAVEVLRDGMGILDALPDRFGLTQATCVLAIATAMMGDWPRVATLLGVIESLGERISGQLFPPVQAAIDAMVAAASRELGAAMRSRQDDGRTIGRRDQIAAALWPADDEAARSDDALGSRLTRREQEVAALIAQGLTNQQIASRLVIAKRTVDTHVQRILAKLGSANRAQVAVFVATGGSLSHGKAVRLGAPAS